MSWYAKRCHGPVRKRGQKRREEKRRDEKGRNSDEGDAWEVRYRDQTDEYSRGQQTAVERLIDHDAAGNKGNDMQEAHRRYLRRRRDPRHHQHPPVQDGGKYKERASNYMEYKTSLPLIYNEPSERRSREPFFPSPPREKKAIYTNLIPPRSCLGLLRLVLSPSKKHTFFLSVRRTGH